MVDIGKQIAHWRSGSAEDWEVARELVGRERVRHGLFFAHLALEKALKAHVCRATSELAPPTHNLVRLAERIALPLEQSQLELLAEVNSFNIEGRYPEMSLPLPSTVEVQRYLDRIEELLTWLNSRF